MFSNTHWLVPALFFILTGSLPADTGKLLRDFVEDYRVDPQATAAPFEFEVELSDTGVWTVRGSGKGEVSLTEGPSGRDGLRFVVESSTLEAIHSGELGVLTAAGKARSSDYAPFDLTMGEEHGLPNELVADLIPFVTHFWTRGYPEITPFGMESSRVIHGAQASALYYTSGLRTAWYGIVGDQHVNAEPKDQVNEFDTLIFVTQGVVKARLDGEELSLQAGRSVHIPAGMTHEFWNEQDDPAEYIIVMFGEGA